MGGKALNSTGFVAKRMSNEEYKDISGDVLAKLKISGRFKNASIVQCYENKKDHGDIDVIVLPKEENPANNWIPVVLEIFRPFYFVKNGPIISFAYRNVQVDLNFTFSNAEYYAASSFFDYSPFGMCCSRMLKQIGLNWTSTGLYYPVYYENQLLDSIHVKCNLSDILDICGFDSDIYFRGFKTQVEIFQYLVTSTFYNPEIFRVQNNKDRNSAKRSDYQNWLQYIGVIGDRNLIKGKFLQIEDKSIYIPMIAEDLNISLKRYIDEIICKKKEIDEIKKKFNGTIALGICREGLHITISEETFGRLFFKFKSQFNDWIQFLKNTDEREIRRAWEIFYESEL